MEVVHEWTTFGDSNSFALGAGVGYRDNREDQWHLALGHFCIHIDGFTYGIVTPDAACHGSSFRRLQDHILRRGQHRCYFSDRPASTIALAYRTWFMGEEFQSESFDYFGRREQDFKNALHHSGIELAPNGDAAFDDGSYVLHFDLDENLCRLVGFRSSSDGRFDPATLRNITLTADEFYSLSSACEAWLADKIRLPNDARLPEVRLSDRWPK